MENTELTEQQIKSLLLYCVENDVKFSDLDDEYNENENGETFEDFLIEKGVDLDAYDEYNSDYLICTDDEANDKWDEALQNYIDDCILPEIPSAYHNYFDEEKWKNDAKGDGRGHALSSYDGEEREVKIDDDFYFIYRIN